MQFTTRTLTPEEVRAHFGLERATINWGVLQDDEPLIYFSAEPEDAGWFNVHILTKRRRLHPLFVQAMSQMMIARMFELGATGLKAEIHPANTACLRLARKVGFQEVVRNEEWVTLGIYDQKSLQNAL